MDASLVIEADGRRETRPFTAPTITFGRSRTCDVVLSDPAVSSAHFKILRQGKAFVLRDLESRNATYVNEEPIRERVLRKGDRIRVGRTTVEFYIGEVPPTLATARAPRRRFSYLHPEEPRPQTRLRMAVAVLLHSPPYLLSTALHCAVLLLLMTFYFVARVPKDRDNAYQVTLVPRPPVLDLAAAAEDGQKPGADSDPFTAPLLAEMAQAPQWEQLAAPTPRPGMAEVPDLPPVTARDRASMAIRLPKKAGGSGSGSGSSTVPPQGGKVDLPPGADIAATVLGRLKGRPGDWTTYGTMRRDNVVVIRGIYDHVEDVLDSLMVPHATVTPKGFDRLKTDSACAVLIDCPGYLNSAEEERLRSWVAEGGYLFTTDWTLTAVSRMFPRTVRQGARQTAEDWVTVAPAREMDEHPLLKDVFAPLKGHPQWWLEQGTYPIQVVDSSKVTVLIDSTEMRRRYGEGAVAVTFNCGKGKVLHVASHFYQVSTDMKTHYSMTQLIVNFLLQARQAHPDR